jgi:hypothetical protein
MCHTGRATAQAFRRFFFAMEDRVQSRIISRAIRGEQSSSGEVEQGFLRVYSVFRC